MHWKYYINDSNDFVTFYTITANLYKLHGPGGFTNRSVDTIGLNYKHENPYSKIHGANMGPIWGRQDPGGSHVGPMNSAIWECPQRSGEPAQYIKMSSYQYRYSHYNDKTAAAHYFNERTNLAPYISITSNTRRPENSCFLVGSGNGLLPSGNKPWASY